MLKSQISESQRHNVSENIELIRLQRENKQNHAQLQSLRAQVQGLEEQLNKVKVDEETARREARDMSNQLQVGK